MQVAILFIYSGLTHSTFHSRRIIFHLQGSFPSFLLTQKSSKTFLVMTTICPSSCFVFIRIQNRLVLFQNKPMQGYLQSLYSAHTTHTNGLCLFFFTSPAQTRRHLQLPRPQTLPQTYLLPSAPRPSDFPLRALYRPLDQVPARLLYQQPVSPQ